LLQANSLKVPTLQNLIAIKTPDVWFGRTALENRRSAMMSGDESNVAELAIHAVYPWGINSPKNATHRQLSGSQSSVRSARTTTVVRFKKGATIFREGYEADAVFSIIDGVVTAYRVVRGAEHVLAFLRGGDLFGLSERGHYTDSVRAATAVVAYKLPFIEGSRAFDSLANSDAIPKLCHELRAAQHHMILLTQRKAVTRLAMFLHQQERLQAARGESIYEVHLPMDRFSIASYLGLTFEALSRAFRSLLSEKIISCRNLRHVLIVNRDAFNELADIH
jgi:CRP-like cAMP-binding protein